jgi:hypothetical protein
MPNLLDLKNKGINNVRVVEHIIFKPRSFKVEMIKMLSVIVIVTAIGFGISNADDLNPFLENNIEAATENFSVLGTVSEITDDKITLVDAKGSDESDKTNYNLNINNLEKVETSSYEPLIITDIKVGDKIIAQGLTDGETFFIKRIVSFSTFTLTPEVATTTPDVATSTTDIATTTYETSTTTEEATTTPTIIEQVGDVVEDIIETVTEVVESVVDAVTGDTPPEEEQEEFIPQPEPESVPELVQ